jgi:cytoskeleton protein RodZ
MATEASSDTRCGIGARLRGARERSGLSILQAAEKLHADPRVLEALEAERFEELGAAVFVRGHIRRYAELVREQPQELQDMYAHSSHAVARPDLTQIPTSGGARAQDPRKLAVPGLMFVIAIGLIGLVWWFLTSLRTGMPPTAPKSVESSDVITEPVVEDAGETTPPPVAAVTPMAGAKSPSVPARSGSVAQSPSVPARPESAAPPAEAGGVPPSVTGTPADTDAAAMAAATEQTPSPPTGKPAEMVLRFSGDSWAEVYDAKGNKLFYDIGSADSVKTLSGTPPYRVILGNPAGVSIEVNGKTATVPQVTGADNGVQFNVNRSGRISRARAAPSGQ